MIANLPVNNVFSSKRSNPARACSRPAARPRVVKVHAAQLQEKPAVAKFADSIGLPTEEGLFGFKPFAETWCGRLAMMGFVTSIVQEAITGQGTLQQIGLAAPSSEVFWLLCAVFGTATLIGTTDTVRKLISRRMTPQDIARYKNFLGLNNPNDFMQAAAAMKQKGDFTSLSRDTAAIQAVRAQGMPADKVLGLNDVSQAELAAREMKASDNGVLTLTKQQEARQVAATAAEQKVVKSGPTGSSVSLAAKADILEQDMFSSNSELAYARQVELTNGRYAMLGFLSAVLVEAVTGKGIIMQVIMYLKLSGLLGAASGF
eukprot:GHRR01002579.1.p1 GENE.GHRR01002579.1~~GHRR01002579.1.p1  ORF type:complete len:317 (+),score=118.88 GHRR01002579.1:1383-2333(+)